MKNVIYTFIFLIIFSACSERNNLEVAPELDREMGTIEVPGTQTTAETVGIQALNIIKYVNAPAGLRVRNSPGLDADIIGVLGNRTKVRAIQEDENNIVIDNIEGRWTLVQTDSIQGWVFGGYLNTAVRMVSSGEAHTLVVMADGSLWAWGYNGSGQLGNGRTESRQTPVRIGSDNDWYSVSAGLFHSVALKTDGSLWAWGGNSQFQLGDNTTINRHTPTRIGTDTDWVSISASSSATMAIKRDGSLWNWGGGANIATGISAVRVPTRVGNDNDWAFVSLGGWHMLAIKTDGSLWIRGTAMGMSEEGINFSRTFANPTQVGTDTDWSTAAAGAVRSSLAIKTDGTLWEWGSWAGVASNNARYGVGPRRISEDTDWKYVSSSTHNSMAIKTDGSLWAWGTLISNEFDEWDRQIPFMEFGNVPSKIWSDSQWTSVQSNARDVVALTPSGSLWAWGLNNAGQLGDGSTTDRSVPVQITFDTVTASHERDYPTENTVTFSLEALGARSFRLTVEGGIFPRDIRSMANHFLDLTVRSHRHVGILDFNFTRNSDTEITFTLPPGIRISGGTMAIAFRPFDLALAVEGDPLTIENWTFQTDPDRSSILLQ